MATKKCQICNSTKSLHNHHKDGNRDNNNIENIVVLCPICHKKIHMQLKE